jgi:hypothetical protein
MQMGSDAALFAKNMQRFGKHSVLLPAALLTGVPLVYMAARMMAGAYKHEIVCLLDSYGTQMGLMDDETLERMKQESPKEFSKSSAAFFASFAWAHALSYIKAFTHRRAVDAVDLCLGFGAIQLLQRCGLLYPLRNFAGVAGLGLPAGMSLYAFSSFATGAAFNGAIRQATIASLPRSLPLLFTLLRLPLSESASIFEMSEETFVSVVRGCSASELALWQLFLRVTPGRIGMLLRRAVVPVLRAAAAKFFSKPPHAADPEDDDETFGHILQIEFLDRGVWPALAVAAVVSFFGQPCGWLAKVLQRLLPEFITQNGPRYTTSCVVDALFWLMLHTFTAPAAVRQVMRSAGISIDLNGSNRRTEQTAPIVAQAQREGTGATDLPRPRVAVIDPDFAPLYCELITTFMGTQGPGQLTRPRTPAFFHPDDSEGQLVSLLFNVDQLAGSTDVLACSIMSDRPRVALTLLEKMARCFPNHPAIEYNMACAASLHGDVTGALSYLSDAIRDGCRDEVKIRSDKDLENLAQDPRLEDLLQKEFHGAN